MKRPIPIMNIENYGFMRFRINRRDWSWLSFKDIFCDSMKLFGYLLYTFPVNTTQINDEIISSLPISLRYIDTPSCDVKRCLGIDLRQISCSVYLHFTQLRWKKKIMLFPEETRRGDNSLIDTQYLFLSILL